MHTISPNAKIPPGFWKFYNSEDTSYHNPALKHALGYTDDQSESLADQVGTPPEWFEITAVLIRYISSRTDELFAQEIKVTSKKGSVFHLSLIGQITARNTEGSPAEMEGTYMDITGYKHLEAKASTASNLPDLPVSIQGGDNGIALSAQQGWLGTFLKYCPAMVAMQDMEMKYVAASDVWKARYNLMDLVIEGKSHYDLFPDTPHIWKQYYQRALEGETIKMEEDSMVGNGEHTEWMQWEIRPWYDAHNQIGGTVIFIIMVSEKHNVKETLIKAKDQAEQSVAITSTFFSVMSHEMRTPLNGVIGFINLLLQDPRLDQLENMNVLKFSAENLLVLINNVLDFSKLDADKVELEEASFDLQNLLENITASLKLEAHTKHLELLLVSDSLIPKSLTGDSARLGQVLINLISNAIKFTKAGKISLTVSVISQDDRATTIAFAIEDTGIGIPADKHEKIFDNFSQANADTTRRYGGTGLGLTISKRIIGLMGSSIKVESQPGQGSIFSFEVTFKHGEEAKLASNDEIIKGTQVLVNAKILIVEDHPINLLVAEKFLKQWQCVPSVAENGLVACEMVQKEDFDLVLMDLQMPVMDGYEATAKIRDMPDQKYRDLPIIALTASSVLNRKPKIVQAGMNDLISKPFAPQQLQELLILHLRKK